MPTLHEYSQQLTIGEHIQRARTEKRWSQAELAQAASTTPAAICQYEKNTRSPRFEAMVAIAEALEVPLFSLTPLSPERQKTLAGPYHIFSDYKKKLDEPDHTPADISDFKRYISDNEPTVRLGFTQALAANNVIRSARAAEADKAKSKAAEIPEDSQEQAAKSAPQLKEQLLSVFLELSTKGQQKLLERANELRILENYQRLLNSEKGTK